MVAICGDDAQRKRPTQHLQPARNRHHMLVQQYEARADRQRIGDRPFGAALPAQQTRKPVDSVVDQFRIRELDDFAGPIRTLQSRQIGAAEQREV